MAQKLTLSNMVRMLRATPLSTDDIITGMEGKAKVVIYPELSRIGSLDQLFEPYNKIILLYLTAPSYGHYVCLWRDIHHQVYYFDSYGGGIDGPLTYNTTEKNNSLGQGHKFLTNLLLQERPRVFVNTYKLQKEGRADAECGRYAILRLQLSMIGHKMFYDLLCSDPHHDSDYYVSLMTSFVS
jgi:hypothetical protein